MLASIPCKVVTFLYFFNNVESKSAATKCRLTKCEAMSVFADSSLS